EPADVGPGTLALAAAQAAVDLPADGGANVKGVVRLLDQTIFTKPHVFWPSVRTIDARTVAKTKEPRGLLWVAGRGVLFSTFIGGGWEVEELPSSPPLPTV